MFRRTMTLGLLGAVALCAAPRPAAAQQGSPAQPDQPRQQQQQQQPQQSQRQQDATVNVNQWPDVAQKAYQEMKGKYGEPDGVTPNRLVWWKKGSFKEIILINEAIDHNFPKPHKDCLEHVVVYDVPVEKVGELAQFDGSIIVDRTRGTMSARCDSEAHNLFALNLADDVVKGKKSVQEARQAYADAAKQQMSGQMPEIGKRLQFEPDASAARAGDPDVALIGPQADRGAQPAAGRQQPEQQQQQRGQEPQQRQ